MTVARRYLLDGRRSFVWWVVGVVGMVAFTVALWPSVRGQEQFEELLRELPDALKALIGSGEGIPFTSPPGYLHGRLFSLVFPVLVLIYGVGLGARAIAGHEEDGTLELVLAHPVTRARVATERYLAMVGLLAGLTLAGLVALVVTAPLVGLLDGVAVGRVLVAGGAMFAIALLHASLAFAAGAATGRRAVATATASAVAVASYLLQGLAGATDALGWASLATPWQWYLDRNLLVEPPTLAVTVLPVALSIAAALAGTRLFTRRDLRMP
ncbi:MAG: ABC transporter permease subunit [Acidimicrobiia bacterium]